MKIRCILKFTRTSLKLWSLNDIGEIVLTIRGHSKVKTISNDNNKTVTVDVTTCWSVTILIQKERAIHPGHCSNNIFKTTEITESNMAAVVSILLIASAHFSRTPLNVAAGCGFSSSIIVSHSSLAIGYFLYRHYSGLVFCSGNINQLVISNFNGLEAIGQVL